MYVRIAVESIEIDKWSQGLSIAFLGIISLTLCVIFTTTLLGGKIMLKNNTEDITFRKRITYGRTKIGDGYELISTTDCWGLYKTLKKAREMFKKLICKDKFLNHWGFMIRGILHKIVRTPTYSHSDVYYNFKEKIRKTL